ncbi:hypothetical protein Pflav_019850 [Phytohabitans flavus]|uniref:Uncharacterized protein n=1 Tax=Phytohabitans flavus TaxID=1076124 RepID=A0A6F8XP17_9ACTN|nr:hypothetical protein Pflav_019850 [Phytohabitans flavus]
MPYVGLKPVSPQLAAGPRIEPPVQVPMPIMNSDAPTPAAEPELDPPGVRARSQGLFAALAVEVASSLVPTLPKMTTPAALSRATAVASKLGTKPV